MNRETLVNGYILGILLQTQPHLRLSYSLFQTTYYIVYMVNITLDFANITNTYICFVFNA